MKEKKKKKVAKASAEASDASDASASDDHAQHAGSASSAASPSNASAPGVRVPRLVIHIGADEKYLWRPRADEWPPTSLAAFTSALSGRYAKGGALSVKLVDRELDDAFDLAELDELLDAAEREPVVTLRCKRAQPTLTLGDEAQAGSAALSRADFAVDRRSELVAARDDVDPDSAAEVRLCVLLQEQFLVSVSIFFFFFFFFSIFDFLDLIGFCLHGPFLLHFLLFSFYSIGFQFILLLFIIAADAFGAQRTQLSPHAKSRVGARAQASDCAGGPNWCWQ